MTTLIKQFILTLIPLVVLDFIWLTSMKGFYTQYLGDLMSSSVKFTPIVLFYILYAAGIMILVTIPGLAQNYPIWKIFLYGAVLGLLAYGAYDFTNHATLKGWKTILTIVDLGWGTLLTATVSAVSVYLMRLFS